MKPSAVEVKEARVRLGLTQSQAADVVGKKLRTWKSWEGGTRNMPASTWELWNIKTGVKK